MSTLNLGHRPAQRGVVAVAAGRMFQVTPPVDVWLRIDGVPGGTALEGDFKCAFLQGGKTYTCQLPAAGGPYFLSGVTTDANGDITPTPLNYVDAGASGI